jgi:hypothetical protein
VATLAPSVFRPSRTFVSMILLSMVVHAGFLYGVRVKTQSLDVPSALTLNATIAAPASASAEPIIAPPPEVAKELPVGKTTPAVKKVAKVPAKKPTPKQALPAEPMAQGHPVPEPIYATSMPEAAPDIAASPAPEKIEPVAEAPSPPPAAPVPIATIHERSGAKVRAPAPIENPTMPAEDIVVAETKIAEEPPSAPTPMPAIATAQHSLEPIAQDGPPRVAVPSIVVNQAKASTQPAETPHEREPAPVAQAPDKVAVIAPPMVNIDPNALPLPASGEAQYKLRMGIVSGELTLSWKFADGHYRLDSIAQGSGIFAVAGKYVQASEGDIAASGLRPATFSVERRGRKESAAFNWIDNSVRFNGKSGERTEAATPGTQDMLSLLFQLAFAPPLGDDLTVIVTNGRKLERYAFERAGNEVISLEGGQFHTLKILKQRKGDEDGMEVWLALEHHYLPVKIRVTDKKGSVIEQSLMAIKVGSAK